MQEIILYDPARSPRSWTELIRPGQYAVFLSDVENLAPVRDDGSPIYSAAEQFCLIFDSIREAEDYCNEAVAKTRRLKCEIFDSAGRANPPVAVIVNQDFSHTLDSESSAGRLVYWGLFACAVSLVLFFYAWSNDAGVVWWPVLLGINGLFAGLRLLQWGRGLKEEMRYRQSEAERRAREFAAR